MARYGLAPLPPPGESQSTPVCTPGAVNSGDYLLRAFFFFGCAVFVAVQAFRWLWLVKTALVRGLLALVAFLVVEHRL